MTLRSEFVALLAIAGTFRESGTSREAARRPGQLMLTLLSGLKAMLSGSRGPAVAENRSPRALESLFLPSENFLWNGSDSCLNLARFFWCLTPCLADKGL